jgi:polyisoprenoid-binding protein YceI
MHTLAFLLALVVPVAAQQAKKIDTMRSKITVHAYKAGLFSFAGHDHVIDVPIARGTLDEQARTIEFTVRTNSLQVLDPEESEKNRAEIRETMLGPKLLEADKFPEISFRSTSVKQTDPNNVTVEGTLMLHGVSQPVSLTVKRDGAFYVGSTKMKQTDYGMKPVSVAGGTIKVKDEVKVEFRVTTE